ncbi:TrkA family potassium uptake protein [Anaerofilum hominis]|uniref:potassium channel family protein n=1 Tax=Anaerofilum hominis TaxID=2763016 RepID=UPI00311AA4E2
MRAKRNNGILIAGCGRLGSGLASMLSARGHSVTVIDRDGRAFRRLPAEFAGFELQGDATDPDILRDAGVETAGLLVAATENDNVNCMIAQIAGRLFGLGQVFARFDDPELSYLVEGSGIHVLCPAQLSMDAFSAVSLLSADEAGTPRRGGIFT